MPFCSIYRSCTLEASTSKYSLPNRCTRNCSTLNTKIDLEAQKCPFAQKYRNSRSARGRKKTPEQNPADSLAWLGLRALLRLEQRLLRPQDRNRLWWAYFVVWDYIGNFGQNGVCEFSPDAEWTRKCLDTIHILQSWIQIGSQHGTSPSVSESGDSPIR